MDDPGSSKTIINGQFDIYKLQSSFVFIISSRLKLFYQV